MEEESSQHWKTSGSAHGRANKGYVGLRSIRAFALHLESGQRKHSKCGIVQGGSNATTIDLGYLTYMIPIITDTAAGAVTVV